MPPTREATEPVAKATRTRTLAGQHQEFFRRLGAPKFCDRETGSETAQLLLWYELRSRNPYRYSAKVSPLQCVTILSQFKPFCRAFFSVRLKKSWRSRRA